MKKGVGSVVVSHTQPFECSSSVISPHMSCILHNPTSSLSILSNPCHSQSVIRIFSIVKTLLDWHNQNLELTLISPRPAF